MTVFSGVLWAGPLYDRGGYGNVSRNLVRALLAARIPVRTCNLGEVHKDIDPAAARIMDGLEKTSLGGAPVGVFHWTPAHLRLYRFRGISARVLNTIFETHSLPPSWAELCNKNPQVWVPSKFNLETFARGGVDPRRLRLVSYPVDCDFFRPGIPRAGIPGARGFVFLYAFSFDWRKGFDLLLRAYGREFKASDPVTLVLKVYGDGRRDPASEILKSALPEFDPGAPGAPRVVVLSKPLDQESLRTLYASCDAYISTDRANGWGMPCMEVMAMGKPAITVDWSGSTEFMTGENALLIRPEPRLEPVHPRLEAERPELYRGQLWPRVRVDEVRRVMRRAYEDRALLERLGHRAAEDIRAHFNFEAVGLMMRKHLEELGDLPPARGEARIFPTCGRSLNRWIRSALRWPRGILRAVRSPAKPPSPGRE